MHQPGDARQRLTATCSAHAWPVGPDSTHRGSWPSWLRSAPASPAGRLVSGHPWCCAVSSSRASSDAAYSWLGTCQRPPRSHAPRCASAARSSLPLACVRRALSPRAAGLPAEPGGGHQRRRARQRGTPARPSEALHRTRAVWHRARPHRVRPRPRTASPVQAGRLSGRWRTERRAAKL